MLHVRDVVAPIGPGRYDTNMVRASLVLAGVAASASIAHAEAMYSIKIVDVTVQDLDSDEKPTGKPRPVTERSDLKHACNLAADPGKGVRELWFQGGVDDGKLRVTYSSGGGPADVVACANQDLVNIKVDLKRGLYRFVMKVRFTKQP